MRAHTHIHTHTHTDRLKILSGQRQNPPVTDTASPEPESSICSRRRDGKNNLIPGDGGETHPACRFSFLLPHLSPQCHPPLQPPPPTPPSSPSNLILTLYLWRFSIHTCPCRAVPYRADLSAHYRFTHAERCRGRDPEMHHLRGRAEVSPPLLQAPPPSL